MRVHSHLGLWVSFLLLFATFCCADDKKVEVIGIGECADCKDGNIKTSHAFKGLRVTIDCKADKGEFKTRGVGELDEEGKFEVTLPQEILKDGKLGEECYAQLHSASLAPCPAHNGLENSKIIFHSKTDKKHTFVPTGKLKFSTALCTSAFLWPQYKYLPLPKLPPLDKWKKPLPKVKFPPFKKFVHSFPPIYKKPLPPLPPFHKKPLPPFPPFHKKPLPPPVPIYKKPLPPPVPVYKKPLPPPVPIYKKPLPPPVPIYKPKPPVVKPKPPVPIYKKPLPPIYKPHPIYKKPLPPPFPFHKPLPPIPKIPPFYKKPLPPFKLPHIPKIPPKYFHHPKFGSIPPLPPLFPHP